MGLFLNIILTILSGGLWLIVWIPCAVLKILGKDIEKLDNSLKKNKNDRKRKEQEQLKISTQKQILKELKRQNDLLENKNKNRWRK